VVEREWREASDLRTSKLGLLAVLVVAAILRFWALGHGIPHAVGVDEPEIVERALMMMKSGALNPHFFDYPGLHLYLQLIVSIVRFVAGAITGAWTSLDQANAESFYLWGRALTATFGVATVMLVYSIGLRWGGRHALLAAGLLAVMPVHVRYSHYVLTDVPLTFFVTLTMLLSLVAHEKNRLGAFALAGAAAGLAAATKYNGGLALFMPLLACWMTVPARPSRLACSLAAIGACLGAFLLAAPYTVLDLPAFLNAFARLSGEYRDSGASAEAPAFTYLKHLRNGMGTPAVLLVAGGLVLGVVRLVRGPGRVRWALAVTFPLLHFFMIAQQQIVFGRYLLPLVPQLCLLAATATVSGVSLLRRYEIPRAPRTALIAALTIAALLPPALQAIAWNRMAGKVSTVDLAYSWVKANVPPGSRIVVEARNLVLPASVAASRNVPQLRSRVYEDYVAEGTDYIVASSQSYGPYVEAPHRFPAEYAQYMRIFEQSRELVRFTPDSEHPGPELRILKVKP
jgi:4-amino-4-deoxy-L-arabinose transferase-like glycosyltransferase